MAKQKEFTRPLRLTSPLTRGDKVGDAQYLMQGHNRFPDLAPYKDKPLDKIYGNDSGEATRKSKFWLGYPENALDRVFGQTLYEYLRVNDWRPLPEDYRKRRDFRLKQAEDSVGMKALREAVNHLGYHESPFGSNEQMFGKWYRLDGEPWCAIFESYCFDRIGHRFRYSYVPNIYEDAKHGRNGLSVVWTPRPGDLALFDFHGEQLAHTAFVRTVPVKGYFDDLGGNTGPTNISNGGAVMSARRPVSSVHAWVRVS